MVKMIMNPDSDEVNSIWAKVQRKHGIKSGDVDPYFVMRLEQKIVKGMPAQQIEKEIDDYYTSMADSYKEASDTVECDGKTFKIGQKVIYDVFPEGTNIPGIVQKHGIETFGKWRKWMLDHGISSYVEFGDAANVRAVSSLSQYDVDPDGKKESYKSKLKEMCHKEDMTMGTASGATVVGMPQKKKESTTSVSDYAVYIDDEWEGEVIHYLDQNDREKKLAQYKTKYPGKKVTLVSMGQHFKIQDKKDHKEALNVGDKVKLRDDVLRRHAKSVPAHAGYTSDQFKWRDTLDKLAGKTGEITRVFSGKHRNVQFDDTLIGIDEDELIKVERMMRKESYKEGNAEDIADLKARIKKAKENEKKHPDLGYSDEIADLEDDLHWLLHPPKESLYSPDKFKVGDTVTYDGERVKIFDTEGKNRYIVIMPDGEKKTVFEDELAPKKESWKKTGLPNSWKSDDGVYVHVFEGHKDGEPTGNWVVRIGKNDDDLLSNQKKFPSEATAQAYAKKVMSEKESRKAESFVVYGNGQWEKRFSSKQEADTYADAKRKKFPKYEFEVREESCKESWKIEDIKKIVDNKQYAKIEGSIVDMQTANLVLQGYNALSPAHQELVLKSPLKRFVDFLWKHTSESFSETQGSLFTVKDAQEVVNRLKSDLNAPYVSAYSSTLGGDEGVSILLTVSLDDKKDWHGGYVENSNYGKFHIDNDGSVEYFSGNMKPNLRKSRVKDVNALIQKLNDYFRTVQPQKESCKESDAPSQDEYLKKYGLKKGDKIIFDGKYPGTVKGATMDGHVSFVLDDGRYDDQDIKWIKKVKEQYKEKLSKIKESFKEDEHDILVDVNGKRVMITTGGSMMSGMDDDGNRYKKVGGKWQLDA